MRTLFRWSALVAVFALLLAPLSFAAVTNNERYYNTSGTATTSDAAITISDATGAFGAKSVFIKNDGGTNSLFYTLGAVATTSSNELRPGESVTFQYDNADGGDGYAAVHVITSASTTAYRVVAKR